MTANPYSMSRLRTPLTELFGIEHPVVLAGMNQAAGPELAAAVSNAGGIGVIGGLHLTPKMLSRQISELKALLRHPSLPYGVDLLLPATDDSARKTNYDCAHLCCLCCFAQYVCMHSPPADVDDMTTDVLQCPAQLLWPSFGAALGTG